MTTKKFETYQYMYLHLHNFWVFNVGYFVVVCSPPLWFLVSKHFVWFKHFILKLHLFCAQTPCICGHICYFLSKPNNHCTTCYKRKGQRQRNGEEEPKRWGANDELKFTDNLYTKNISIQTSEQDVSKSLISIFTFIKELYNSIHSQVPAPMSHGCLVREKLNERMNQGAQGVGGLV